MIRSYLKISEKFVLLILKDRFRVVHKPLVCRVKFYHFFLLRVFHTSICRWFLTGVWVTVSSLVFRTLLSILADLNNPTVWMVSTRPFISKSPSHCINPLVTLQRAPITIGIIVTFMWHSFFNPQARSRYLSFFSLSFNFTLWSARTAKSKILQVLFFCCFLLV